MNKKVKLNSICEILDNKRKPLSDNERQERIKNKSIDDLYPYYGATKQVGYIDDYIFNDELILLGEDGVMFYDPTKPKAYLIKGKSWVNNHAHVLKIDNAKANTNYILYYLNIFNYQGYVSGSTRLKLNKSKMCEIPIPLPSLEKQNQIAKTLDRANELIELRKESITKLDALAKSIFIDMFGDPVSNHKGWEIVKLGEYGKLSRGKSSHRPRNAPSLYGGKYPFIQTGDVARGKNTYIIKYTQTYSEEGIRQSKLFPKDTIAITIAANIGDAKILSFDSYFPDSVVGFNVNIPLFVVFLLKFYKYSLEQQATSTAQKNINLQVLNDLDVIYPQINLQNKFAKIIEKIEEQKSLYEKELELLQNNFDALLQKSFQE